MHETGKYQPYMMSPLHLKRKDKNDIIEEEKEDLLSPGSFKRDLERINSI